MKKILIIYFSREGNTKLMAEAVRDGVKKAGAEPILKKAAEATTDDIKNSDAVVFGSPNYFGYMAGAIQIILEEIFIKLKDFEAVKPYAVFSSAGTMGGEPAIKSIEEICDRLGGKFGKFSFKKAAEGVGTPKIEAEPGSVSGKPAEEVLQKCRELGQKIASL